MAGPSLFQKPRGASDSPFTLISERIAVAIVSGALPVGAVIPNEDDLRGEITASRTAFREALRFLSGKGLVEARPRSGTRVAPRSHWHLLDPDVLRWSLSAANEQFVSDLFELRGLIEPGCARLAALRRNPVQLARIEAALLGMRGALPYTEAAMAHDLDFHSTLFEASGNATLAAMRDVVATTLLWSLRLQKDRAPDSFATPYADHRRVFDAIARRDGEMAETMMRVLVADALRDTLDALRRSGAMNHDMAEILPLPRRVASE